MKSLSKLIASTAILLSTACNEPVDMTFSINGQEVFRKRIYTPPKNETLKNSPQETDHVQTPTHKLNRQYLLITPDGRPYGILDTQDESWEVRRDPDLPGGVPQYTIKRRN